MLAASSVKILVNVKMSASMDIAVFLWNHFITHESQVSIYHKHGVVHSLSLLTTKMYFTGASKVVSPSSSKWGSWNCMRHYSDVIMFICGAKDACLPARLVISIHKYIKHNCNGIDLWHLGVMDALCMCLHAHKSQLNVILGLLIVMSLVLCDVTKKLSHT